MSNPIPDEWIDGWNRVVDPEKYMPAATLWMKLRACLYIFRGHSVIYRVYFENYDARAYVHKMYFVSNRIYGSSD